MASRKVRIIIIGAGNWATTAHIPALARHPSAEIVGLLTRDEKSARKTADDFSIRFASSDVATLIRESKPDAAIISSVAAFHYEHAKLSLEAGLHVLIEKPMTFTVAEAEELQQIADQKGLHFLISCPWHYSPHVVEARRLLQSGALGEIKMISELFTNFGLGLYQGLPWEELFSDHSNPQNLETPYVTPDLTSHRDPALSGGGQIYCQNSHALALLAFLTGREPAEVYARFDYAGLAQDVYNVLNIKFDDGVLASITSCMLPTFTDRQHEVRIFGSEGMLLLELWKGQLELHDASNNIQTFPNLSEEEAYPMYAPAENLVDVIIGKSANGSPASLGVTAMRGIEAACESARTNANVLVDSGAT